MDPRSTVTPKDVIHKTWDDCVNISFFTRKKNFHDIFIISGKKESQQKNASFSISEQRDTRDKHNRIDLVLS